MFASLRVAVVMPAFNEQHAIAAALRTVPAWVDHVIVVDDASVDDTGRVAATIRRPGLEVLRHETNRGVGAAIASGYRRARELGVDAAVVMAGDGQMHPDDLPALLWPLAGGEADYVKGNRFADAAVWREMPVTRIIGNIMLSLATKVTSGYWLLFDSQCGYTAASRLALAVIDADGLFPRYGYPNDLLARLHKAGLLAIDAPVRAVYGPRWRSGIRFSTVIYPMSFVLLRSWMRRLFGRLRPATAEAVRTVAAERQQTAA